MDGSLTRRRLLAAAGGTIGSGVFSGGVASAARETPAGADFGGWLDGVDGGFDDATGKDEVTVLVGAEGNNGPYAFSPAGLAVSPGTTVRWQWTGHASHNIRTHSGPAPLDSGDVNSDAGVHYEYTFEERGTTKYYCQPHKTLGMKGAVVVGDGFRTDASSGGDDRSTEQSPGTGGLPVEKLGMGAAAAVILGAGVAWWWPFAGDDQSRSRQSDQSRSRQSDQSRSRQSSDAKRSHEDETRTGGGDGEPSGDDPGVTAGADADGGSGGPTAGVEWNEPSTVPAGPDLDLTYDDFERRDRIAGGSSAMVYRATVDDGGRNRAIAVKEPRFEGTLDADIIDRFVREAETWAGLDDHDHVVDLVDWGTEPVPWLAMEYMDGGSLAAVAGSLSLDRALWTALGVVAGVRHAHDHGVVHLDLKPANVLFRGVEDGWDVPKVADWGLARLLLEQTGTVEGFSPQYAAPEQVDDGFGEPGKHTDVYQLGAVCYELVVGRPPHVGARPAEVVRATVEEPVTPPTEVDPSLPADLDDILGRALAKRPDDRHEHILYFRDDLRAVAESL